jgi:hypothetical protein
MDGNDIEDLGNGSFRTVGAVQRYSLLDQYAMGLVDRHHGFPPAAADEPVGCHAPGSVEADLQVRLTNSAANPGR